LVSGDKSVVFPILQWLLEKVPEHKERAYLGRYLSKIDVPTEFLSDPEIAEQYERVNKSNIILFYCTLNFSTMN
jgi:intraflagellar transport protein 81